MGTKLQCKSYLPSYYSMRNLNEDSNSCSWPLYYGDKTLTNGQYYNGFLPKGMLNAYAEYDKDVVKQTMIEHEAIFKKQVYELHRVYRIQRDLMNDIKRQELRRNPMCIETLFSSSPLASHITSEDAHKWNIPGIPLANSVCGRRWISVVEDSHSPISCKRGRMGAHQSGVFFASRNGVDLKDVGSSRPTKVRRKMIDLDLPADEYIDDTDEAEDFRDDLVSGLTTLKTESQTGEKTFIFENSHDGLADLNEPIRRIEQRNGFRYTNPTGHNSCYEEIQGHGRSAGPRTQIRGLPKDMSLSSYHVSNKGPVNKLHTDKNGSGTGWFSHVLGSGHSGTSSNVATSYSNSPPDMAPKSWSHRVMSYENSSSNLVQKSILAQTDPFLAKTAQRNEIHGDMWPFNQSSRDYRSEVPNRNGFHHASSSGSREQQHHHPHPFHLPPPISKNNGSSKIQNGSSGTDPNLNVVLSNGPNVEAATAGQQQGVVTVLPWLRGKPSCKNEKVDCSGGSKRVLGFPIFDKSNIISTDTLNHRLSEREGNNGKRIVVDINLPCDLGTDFNQDDAEEGLVMEKETDAKITRSIDLNLCVSEDDESSFAPICPRADTKGTTEIELETHAEKTVEDSVRRQEIPATSRILECKDEHDDLMRVAAEAIVAISSNNECRLLELRSGSCEVSVVDPLHWFADVINSFGDNLERTVAGNEGGGQNGDCSSERIDFFESMTLNLIESTEEDYMPKPLVPESLKLDEVAAQVPNRTRKGHARRGRQRRDFQRDILPGLTSLSRHEVTEDLQMFGGLMKATGQTWEAGSTRRNSSRNGRTRGKRQLVDNMSLPPLPTVVAASSSCGLLLQQQFSNIEAGLEDRSLTGWGKTTRRPRRQRCPAGNPSYVALT